MSKLYAIRPFLNSKQEQIPLGGEVDSAKYSSEVMRHYKKINLVGTAKEFEKIHGRKPPKGLDAYRDPTPSPEIDTNKAEQVEETKADQGDSATEEKSK